MSAVSFLGLRGLHLSAPFSSLPTRTETVSVFEGLYGVYKGLLGMVGLQGNSLLPRNPHGVTSLFPSRVLLG